VDEMAWKKSACILCECNCGIEIQLGGDDGRRFERIRGDKAHPASAGYTCQKALRLDHYQNGRHRLTSPLRRRADGSFEEIDWDTAISEVAQRLMAVRDTYGGKSIFYYGGGGQGNILPGMTAASTLAALGAVYRSNALAQEKTGEFWVDSQLYGGHSRGEFERSEVVMFLGKNPWQSHSFPHARPTLKAIARDPNRTLVVIDPRRTETAEMADMHLPVRPGTDAWLLAALLGALVQEDLVNHDFLERHTTGAAPVLAALRSVPVAEYCRRSGIAEAQLRALARRIGAAASYTVFEDLGVQQAPHSTLSSYLEKLTWLLTGSFAKPGGMYLHSHFLPLLNFDADSPPKDAPNGGGGAGRVSPVTGSRIITGLVPCNVIPDEILTDHPDRFRAMMVEASNPAHSLANSKRMREALAALDLLVVVDVAMTETARLADYVLPSSSQFEKWECTFFSLEFPGNCFHLRAPVLDPLPGTLSEPEIHARLVRAMGVVSDEELAPLRAAAAQGREVFGPLFLATVMGDKRLGKLFPYMLYETLGPTLPDGAAATSVLWAAAHHCAMTFPDAVRRAGFTGESLELGESLFDAVLAGHSGIIFTVDDYDTAWDYVKKPGRRFSLEIPELLDELAGLADEPEQPANVEFPFVLTSGERRSYTANTIYRDPTWRRRDQDGALRINPADAERLGIIDSGRAKVTTKVGSVTAVVEITDSMQAGHVSLPNGYGLDYPDEHGNLVTTGVAPNELTSSEDRDPFAGTPWHKHVRARVEAASTDRVPEILAAHGGGR